MTRNEKRHALQVRLLAATSAEREREAVGTGSGWLTQCENVSERTTRNEDERKREIARSPVSPLLSNIYMRRFIRGWKALGHEQQLRARIVNYAADFVICCRADAAETMATMRVM
jgi:hypothetical protein